MLHVNKAEILSALLYMDVYDVYIVLWLKLGVNGHCGIPCLLGHAWLLLMVVLFTSG